MTELQQQQHRDLAPTTVWAYGSGFPGPVIEATVGEPLQVRWINDLRDEPRCERSWKRDGTVKERSDGGMLTDRDADAVGVT